MPFPGLPPQLCYAGPRPNEEMSQDFHLWKRQVRRAIASLCTFEVGRGPDRLTNAGFHTAMHRLYVEGHFTDFLSYQAWRQAGVGETAGRALKELQRELDAYDEPDTDVAILADPTWWAIMGLALQVVDLLA